MLFARADEQIAEGGGGEDKVALFVRLIERNDLFVAAEPVKDRIRVVDPAVVGLEGDAVQQAAAEGHAARACDGVCDMGRAEGGGVRAGGEPVSSVPHSGRHRRTMSEPME